MLALAPSGASKPPASWKDAMNASATSVFTYYKCSDFKKGVCAFTAP